MSARERELEAEVDRLREANRRLQAEPAALARDALVEQLSTALWAALEVARGWHMRIAEADQASAWRLYYEGSPELAPVRAVFGVAPLMPRLSADQVHRARRVHAVLEAAKESVRLHQPDAANPRKHTILRLDGETQEQAVERAWRAELALFDAVALAFPDLHDEAP